MSLPLTVVAVVGENLRRLREQSRLTQHETAHLVRRHDPRWNRGKVEAIEAGRRQSLDFADVVVLAIAFNVELAEFFAGDGAIQLTEHATLGRNVARAILRGHHVREELRDLEPDARRNKLLHVEELAKEAEATMHPGATEADEELARRLDLPLKVVTAVAYSLWDGTLTEERDSRAAALGDMDSGERQAHRGHITRKLSQQLEAELTRRGVEYDPPNEAGKKRERRKDC